MAVSRLNTNTASHVASGTLSRAVTINSGGTDVVAFAVLAFDSNGSIGNYVINSVTLGGQTMTSCGTPITVTYGVAVYYLVNPPTGSQTLAVSISNATEIYSNVVVFQGVDQTTPVRAGSYSTANSNTRTISSAVGDLTLTVCNGGPTGLSSTNQTSDGIDGGGNFGMGSDHATTSATSVTHTWTGPSGSNCGIAGISIQQASGTSSITGAATVASKKPTISASGNFTPAAVTGTVASASKKATVSATGSYTPPAITGTATVASQKSSVTSSGTVTIGGVAGTANVASQKASLAATGTATPPTFTGTAVVATKKAAIASTGTNTPPAFSGSAVVAATKAAVSASGTLSIPAITGTASVAAKKPIVTAFGTFTPEGYIPPTSRTLLLLGIGQ